ncbi:Di-glucose binding protein with kinesin motor domain [Globisporangium polare]
MDSPTRDQQQQHHRSTGHKGEEQQSLGQLLVDMTAQVQDERQKRSDVERRNHSLMLEIEQLQKDMLDLKTSCVSERRRRGSEELEAAKLEAALPVQQQQQQQQQHMGQSDESAELYWKELQEAKKVKEKALVEAHQRAMQVMELNACISMQHDELKALRSTENEARVAMIQAEDHCKELIQQSAILQQENRILKDDVAHLNAEIGKRGVHFKALMEKWTEAQAQSEHLERENHAMLDKMKELRQRGEHLALELDKARDERDCLQHQVNHLKGAVAAKAAESKAFQAYGSNARDHLQAQNTVIQRHQVFRRKIHKVARDSVVTLKTLKMTLAAVRAPIVAIQNDFRAFLKNLQAPVVSLVSRSRRFAEVAHAEHQPLRHALLSAELTRRHLHEQLWKARRNALLICQIRNSQQQHSCEPTISDADASRALRANYATGELLMKESERETLAVRFDAIYSDRAREWNNFESVVPVVQSVLDGCNACVATFDTLLPLRTSSSQPLDDSAGSTETVPALVLRELFDAAHMHGVHFHRMKITISYLGVFNECIYDLLGLDTSLAGDQQQLGNAIAMSQIVVLEVQNLDEALLVLGGGLENLQSAHERGLMSAALTHKVVTICLTYENLLSGVSMTKSKLQIVELAVGSQYTAVQEHDWDDRGKLKALVTMENGVSALVTALAEVRVKDPAFVRYHSSKLTVLLQDTVKTSAKFLAIVALPASIPQGDEGKVSTVIRSIQQFRSAVCVTSTSSPWGKTSGGAAANGSRDRSLEGFMSRFAQQQQQQQAQSGSGEHSSALSMLFSSSDIQERARQALDVNGDGAAENVKWEKELDNMNKRYGPDVDLFATSFFQPSKEMTVGSVPTRDSLIGLPYQNGPAGDRQTGAPGFDDDSDDDSVTGASQQHSPMTSQGDARIHLHEYELSANPPPAPVSATSSSGMSRRAKSSFSRAMSSTKSALMRVSSARSSVSVHSRPLADKKTKLKKQQSMTTHQSVTATIASTTRPTVSTYSARVAAKASSNRAATLAPASATAASASAPMLKIRRETASSTLKKSRVAAIVAASSPFARQQKKRTPFK